MANGGGYLKPKDLDGECPCWDISNFVIYNDHKPSTEIYVFCDFMITKFDVSKNHLDGRCGNCMFFDGLAYS